MELSEEAYDRLFQDLVKVADMFTATAQKTKQGERLMDQILARAEKDLPKNSDELYGLKQDIASLRDSWTRAQEALDDFGQAYDALNRRALKYKLR